MDMDRLIARYEQRLPRYTSYPTAPHFGPSVDAATYAVWLAALPAHEAISLYLHVPFCRTLCHFCGCHTTAVNNPATLASYAGLLRTEIGLLARVIGRRLRVSHIHWGGGTPTSLAGADMIAISAALGRHFDIDAATEIAVEIDPRVLTADRLAALAAIGITRASLGVQDFDPSVQRAIGREQSFAETAEAAAALRAIGVGSLNLDLLYGLPYQSAAGLRATVRAALSLQPDRLAVFGYAHVPWMQRHQALIPEAALPDTIARFHQRELAERLIAEAGYTPIGLDHFARAEDSMAVAARAGGLRRNFQGYTTDQATALIGLGASAIGALPQGYAQNAARVPAYRAALDKGQLPVARGVALNADDRLRRAAIERVMCDLALDLPVLIAAHDAAPDALDDAHPALDALAADGLIAWDGEHLAVAPAARPFLRVIAACFDRYLPRAASSPVPARHALAI